MSSQPDIVAAVDLGSNSFHMILARVRPQSLEILDQEALQLERIGWQLTTEQHG